MDGFSVSGFSGPVPSPRDMNVPRRNGRGVGGLGGLGSGGRPSRSAVALAAAAPAPTALAAASSPRQPTIGAEIRAEMGLERPAPSAYSPRKSAAATVAGARGRWNNLIESADDEVRAIMTPDAAPAFGGLDEKDDCGFGDLGLDDHERAVLEQSLRRQAKIERKLNRMAQQERQKKDRSHRKSSRREREQRKLDLSGGTAGPEQFAAAAAGPGASPRSRRARGVIKPKSGRHADDDVSQWDTEVALASGLPAVRGASTTPTNEMNGPHTPRHKATAPSSARGSNQSPRGSGGGGGGSSRRKERRERRERRATEEAAEDDEDDERAIGDSDRRMDNGVDKMEKLRLAMAQMDGEELSPAGAAAAAASGSVEDAAAMETPRQGVESEKRAEDPAEAAAAAAAAKVAAAKAKAEAAVKEAARLVSGLAVQPFLKRVCLISSLDTDTDAESGADVRRRRRRC